MRIATALVALVIACGGEKKGTACERDADCLGAQLCWCEPIARARNDDRCLSADDLPSGTCVSRAEGERRASAWMDAECKKLGRGPGCYADMQREQRAQERRARVEQEAVGRKTLRAEIEERNKLCEARGASCDCKVQRIDNGDGTFAEVKACTPRTGGRP